MHSMYVTLHATDMIQSSLNRRRDTRFQSLLSGLFWFARQWGSAWYFVNKSSEASRESVRRRTDATKYIISLALQSIIKTSLTIGIRDWVSHLLRIKEVNFTMLTSTYKEVGLLCKHRCVFHWIAMKWQRWEFLCMFCIVRIVSM